MSLVIFRPKKFYISYRPEGDPGDPAAVTVYGMRAIAEHRGRLGTDEGMGDRLFELRLPDDLWFEKLSAWLTGYFGEQLLECSLREALTKESAPLSDEDEEKRIAGIMESFPKERYKVWLKENQEALYATFLQQYEKERAEMLAG